MKKPAEDIADFSELGRRLRAATMSYIMRHCYQAEAGGPGVK